MFFDNFSGLDLSSRSIDAVSFFPEDEHYDFGLCNLCNTGIYINLDSKLIIENTLFENSVKIPAAQPVCGKAELIPHVHNESCFDEYGNLICTLPTAFAIAGKARGMSWSSAS